MTATREHPTGVPAAQARREHSIASAFRNGAELWFPLLAPIAAWAVHIVLFAALVRYSCNVSGATWVFHVATAVGLAVCAVAAALAVRLYRRSGDDADTGDAGRLSFLGRLALIVAVANIMLIALEELYFDVLAGRRCG